LQDPFLIKIDKASEARQWLIDSDACSAGGWTNGAEVWATVFCCPHVREAICTVCPRLGGEPGFSFFGDLVSGDINT
jgi:hypothetical protein